VRDRIQTIGVTSAIGDSFMLSASGLLVGSQQSIPVSDWKIDELVISDIAEKLKPKYRTVPVVYDFKDFDTTGGGLFGDAPIQVNFGERVHAIEARGVRPDAYIVITKMREKGVTGLGLVRDASILGNSFNLTMLHGYYFMTVVDGHTFARIGAKQGSDPLFPMEDISWPNSENPLTEAQKQRVQQALKFFLDGSLEATLRDGVGLLDPTITEPR